MIVGRLPLVSGREIAVTAIAINALEQNVGSRLAEGLQFIQQ
jgi:hypothetical protein